ncbi:hypothetical protein [Nakamurella sp.]|uniref:hypothetical protein n=1 Tax=Nakamurella sp. TaxID=1869182 RepID=UPI0037848D9F
MATVAVNRMWDTHRRLQPWVVYDLERVAWIVEARAGDLTDAERVLVRDAAARLGRAVDSDRG